MNYDHAPSYTGFNNQVVIGVELGLNRLRRCPRLTQTCQAAIPFCSLVKIRQATYLSPRPIHLRMPPWTQIVHRGLIHCSIKDTWFGVEVLLWVDLYYSLLGFIFHTRGSPIARRTMVVFVGNGARRVQGNTVQGTPCTMNTINVTICFWLLFLWRNNTGWGMLFGMGNSMCVCV